MGMSMWVRVVVEMGVMCLRSIGSAQRRHGMGTGIFTQGSQGWGIGAQIWTPKPDSQSTLRASNNSRSPCHGRDEKGMRYRMRERRMQRMRVVKGVRVGVRVVVLVLWMSSGMWGIYRRRGR